MKQDFKFISGYLFLLLFIAGCPRLAYIEIYNNTSTEISIDSSGLVNGIMPKQSLKFQFGNDIQVTSDKGIWDYQKIIPHGGEDGPYFNGTLKLQLNEDGYIYALKVSDSFPLKNSSDQPKDYPLIPK